MIKELNQAFSDITYQDSTHSYFSNGNKLTSVTQFLSKLKEPFDKEYWSTYKAYEFSGLEPKYNWKDHQNRCFTLSNGVVIYLTDIHEINVSPEDVLEQWNLDNIQGTERGSYFHNYLECKEQRLLDLPKVPYIKNLDTIQTIKFYNSIKTGTLLCDEYLEYAKQNLIPIALEYIIGSKQLGIAGRFDRLYWNIQDQEYQIWDFKTDKKIDYSSSKKFDIFNIPDCAYDKYSLQCSMYKYIIESQTEIQLGKSNIVWFDIKGNSWSIIPTKDYTQLIKEKSDEISWRTHIST